MCIRDRPWGYFELVVDEFGGNPSIYANGRGRIVGQAVRRLANHCAVMSAREHVVEVIVLVLTKSVDSDLNLVPVSYTHLDVYKRQPHVPLLFLISYR